MNKKQHYKKDQPLVSIVMPVYNAGKFLGEALESMLGQTYTNWELFCFDDLSTDNSWEILKKFAKKDKRIQVFHNGHHRGVAGAANEALKRARGIYIARMDADDVSLPDRLEIQLAFLESHRDVVAVGGQCEIINARGKQTGVKLFPTDPNQVYKMIFSSIPLQQPTLMVAKKRLPKDFVWYKEGMRTAEEVELLFKFLQVGKVVNVPETVLQYRIHGNNVSLIDPKKTFFYTIKARLAAVAKYGYKPTLSGWMITLMQSVAVFVLPSSLIYPLYFWLRGCRKELKRRLWTPAVNFARLETE